MSERHQDTHALDAFMRQRSSGGQHDGDVHALVHRGFTVHNLRLRNPDATNAFAACHLPAPPAAFIGWARMNGCWCAPKASPRPSLYPQNPHQSR